MEIRLPTSLIIYCDFANHQLRTVVSQQAEIKGLARAIGLAPLKLFAIKIRKPNATTLIAQGKIKEIKIFIQAKRVELVIFNRTLSPRQQQALENLWEVKILDRTGLILEIFANRARTKEAKLQTSLAQLAYQKNRLVRSWTHLERQRGGAGFMGGPGERQIESDRRQIRTRINSIQQQLEAVRRRRKQTRKARKNAAWSVVALVGYTNAGKSTLFNRLTGADKSTRNMLFDTLDATMRALSLADGSKVILSDTVGFISDLPPDLIAAFRATLEEITSADLIIHVRDSSSAECLAQKLDVDKILQALNLNQPVLEVFNKIDCSQQQPLSCRLPLAISAKTGEGVDALLEQIQVLLVKQQSRQHVSICLTPAQAQAQAFLYEKGHVLGKTQDEHGAQFEVLLPEAALGMFKKKFRDIKLSAISLP